MTEENVLEGYAIVKRLAVGLFAGLAFASAAAPSSADESRERRGTDPARPLKNQGLSPV